MKVKINSVKGISSLYKNKLGSIFVFTRESFRIFGTKELIPYIELDTDLGLKIEVGNKEIKSHES
jgi:hypothetical protein